MVKSGAVSSTTNEPVDESIKAIALAIQGIQSHFCSWWGRGDFFMKVRAKNLLTFSIIQASTSRKSCQCEKEKETYNKAVKFINENILTNLVQDESE